MSELFRLLGHLQAPLATAIVLAYLLLRVPLVASVQQNMTPRRRLQILLSGVAYLVMFLLAVFILCQVVSRPA